MRNIVVCIFVIQSWCVWADNNVLNKDLSNSKNYSFTTNHISNNTDINGVFSQTYNLNNITLNHFSGDNSTLSEQVQNFSKLLFTHNQSLFKPEVFQAQEQNQISLHYLHFGQNIALTPTQNTWLYSGAGLTYFDSQNSQYNDNTALSFSVGAHSKLFVNNRLTVSLNTKLYGTYINKQADKYCVNDRCQLNASNDFWLQKQVSLNLSFHF